MEPVSWRPGFAPPATPLTRRLLVYFRSGAYTLASVIANEFNEVSSETYLSALIYCGLILFVLTVGVNILAYYIIRRLAGIRGFSA